VIPNLFAETEETVNSKSFEELVKSGVILKSVPKPIRGIWNGKLVLFPFEGEDQFEIIDMCNYPIKISLKFKS